MTNEEMSAKLLKFIESRPGASFVEIQNLFPDETGHNVLGSAQYPNILFWVDLSEQLSRVTLDLLQAGKLEARGANVLVYLADGAMLKMQLAKAARNYKEPRWLPVVLYVAGTAPGR